MYLQISHKNFKFSKERLAIKIKILQEFEMILTFDLFLDAHKSIEYILSQSHSS